VKSLKAQIFRSFLAVDFYDSAGLVLSFLDFQRGGGDGCGIWWVCGGRKTH